MAVFEIKLMGGGDKYALIRFKAEHTHELGPPKFSRHLKNPAHVPPHVDSSLPRGVKAADIPEEVGLSDPNTRSGFLNRGDAHFLLEYFRQKKQENKHFFYSFRTDGDGNICGVFYCDAKSRRDYGLFGDAVCFDTTFRINDMVCVPVIGINNHGQPALFGCGLLDGETTDSALWLFTMGGKKPISIFTNESAFISNAVSAVFPEAHHGLCLWHLFQNASKHLTEVFKAFKSFSVQFKVCIYDPETVEEFEERWSKLLNEYGLRGIVWLQSLYELRKMWAQVYSRGHFCAGMTVTGRSENISKFLKAYFSTGSIPLREFVDQYSKAMVDQYEKEKEAEKRTHQTEPNLISAWPIECEASKLYTREMFYGFQEELQQIIDLLLELVSDDGIIRTYRATEMEGQKKIRTLIYNHTEQSVYCSCNKFEFNGILCSHALKLFRNLQYKILPPKYYVKRWTRKATEDDVFDPFGELIPNNSDPSSTARYDALLQISQISQRIATKCSKSEEVFSLTNLLLQEVEAKMEGCNTKEERRPPVQKTTIKTTPAVQETTIQTTPAVQETTIQTTPAVQQTTIKTTPAVQETIMKTTPAVQKTTIKTTPAVKKTTTKTTPAVQEATIKTTPAVRKTTIKTTPAVQETTIKTTPTVQKTTIKTTPAVKKTTTKTNPAVKKTTTKTNAAVKKTTTKTNRNQEASGLLPGQQQQPNHSQTGWQWMSQRAVPPLRAIQPLFVAEPLQVVYPQGVHPPDILPPYNSVTCQGRPYLQNSLFAPQQ